MTEIADNPYETEQLLEEYLLLHYGASEAVLPWAFGPREALDFPARCVDELVTPVRGARALELGCAVGRACFELSTFCSEVVGIDFSQSFIREAERLAREGQATFTYADEGELRCQTRVELSAQFHRDRVRFEVGDATSLRGDLGSFDIVLACNLLCRVPDPSAVLKRFADLVRPGGQLVITSPYTWMEQYTPRERWLGGFLREGQAVRSLSSLQTALEASFELEGCSDMPFLIREHARKFQWSVAQASRWRRRSA